MGEERVRDILNGLLIEFGWIPWGTFKLAKTQHMNSDIVLAVHKSKKTLFFNLGVISKIINKSEVEFKLYVEECDDGSKVWTRKIAGSVFDSLKDKYGYRNITFSKAKAISGYKKLAHKTYKNININNLQSALRKSYKDEWEDIISDLLKIV